MKTYAIKGKTVIFDDDFELGRFDFYWDITSKNYVRFQPKDKSKPWVRVHRYILGLDNGGGEIVDHIDRNPLNNQRNNLRIVRHEESLTNRGCYRRPSGKELPKYVYAKKKHYYVSFRKHGKDHHCGSFRRLDDAVAVASLITKRIKKGGCCCAATQ